MIPARSPKILNRIKRKLASMIPRREVRDTNKSYSQCGEDRIVAFLCSAMGISRPTYLDVGANDPIKLSNTYLFYRNGCRGVCVEPNPDLFRRLRKVRPQDVCLNVGIGFNTDSTLPFYMFGEKANGLSSLSKRHAETNARFHSVPVERVLDIPLKNINDVVRDHFDQAPNFLSIDVEGLDLEVLQTLDFNAFGADIICAETLLHAEREIIKDQALSDFILTKGYRLYADTYVNSIFVRADRFPAV